MTDDTKICPMCAETVKAAAVRCRFCGHDFTAPPSFSTQESRAEKMANSASNGIMKVGCSLFAILLLVGYCSSRSSDVDNRRLVCGIDRKAVWQVCQFTSTG